MSYQSFADLVRQIVTHRNHLRCIEEDERKANEALTAIITGEEEWEAKMQAISDSPALQAEHDEALEETYKLLKRAWEVAFGELGVSDIQVQVGKEMYLAQVTANEGFDLACIVQEDGTELQRCANCRRYDETVEDRSLDDDYRVAKMWCLDCYNDYCDDY